MPTKSDSRSKPRTYTFRRNVGEVDKVGKGLLTSLINKHSVEEVLLCVSDIARQKHNEAETVEEGHYWLKVIDAVDDAVGEI